VLSGLLCKFSRCMPDRGSITVLNPGIHRPNSCGDRSAERFFKFLDYGKLNVLAAVSGETVDRKRIPMAWIASARSSSPSFSTSMTRRVPPAN